MKENRYDDPVFFEKYSQMSRSREGLKAAGEWSALEPLLPDFRGKAVLDLGCGYGWHAKYAADHGARRVVASDISRRMLERARKINRHPTIFYRQEAFEDAEYRPGGFDVVLCSLMLHYLSSYDQFLDKVTRWLKPGGQLIYTVEHPVFTAAGSQDWEYDETTGAIRCFPVDQYYLEGERDAVFLGEHVTKYHRTLTTYLEGLLRRGYTLEHVVEPQPTEEMVRTVPGMADELRRPMMLIVSARRGGRKGGQPGGHGM